MATKAELEAALADRDRERPTVSTVAALPVMVCGALLMVAVLYLAARQFAPERPIPPTTLAIPGLVGWLVGHVEAKAHFTSRIYGGAMDVYARLLAAVVGASATGWLVWTGYVGPGETWFALVLGGFQFGLLWWALLWAADRRLRPADPVVTATGDVDHAMPWADILERTTDGQAILTAVDYHRAGVKLTVEPGQQTDDDGNTADEDMTFDDFARVASSFGTLASKEYRRRTGDRFPLNCARPEVGRDDAEFVLHVTMRDVFNESTIYKPSLCPQDIRNPLDLGEYEDATRILITLFGRHAKIVGMTGSGKSVEANNWIARITECANALVWICATDKLIPLVWPWLRSWFAGTAPQPCLDYVAGLHIDNVLGMLADAYKLCTERNAQLTDESKMTPTTDMPAVFVFIEELSHAVEFGDTIVTHDGMECDVSTLLMLIARGGRSAGVHIVPMSQTALNSSMGDNAAEIIRNLTIRVCLRTMESHDGYRTIPALNNVDTTSIPLHTKIVQPSIERARAMPGKAPELDGTVQIDPIAIRNAGWRPVGGVEADSDLGDRYRDRWNPARHPELARAVQKYGLEWRIPNALVNTGAPVKMTPADPAKIADIKGGDDMVTWTDADDAALTNLLGSAAGPPDDGNKDEPEARRAGGFRFPNGDRELQRMRDLAKDIAENPWNPDEVGEEPNPVPPPMNAIITWLDAMEDAGATATFYLSETIAVGIGHPDHHRMGREIWRVAKIRSRQATAAEDGTRKRKGYDVSTLRQAAARIRFGL